MIKKGRNLFVGLDLSFSSSGITFMIVEDQEPITLNFQLLLYDKKYKPLRGVTQNTYKLPTNLTPKKLTVDNLDDPYSEDQNFINLKYIMASKNLVSIVKNYIKNNGEFENIIIAIEGFISPQVMGQIQFRSLTGLIMMQGYIRGELISCYSKKIKFNVVSPSHLKLFFTGNGNATKIDMLNTFISDYDGHKLVDTESLGKINDIVDSFALIILAFFRFYHTDKYNSTVKVKTKLQKKINNKNNKTLIKPNTIKKVKKTKAKVNEPINFEQWIP